MSIRYANIHIFFLFFHLTSKLFHHSLQLLPNFHHCPRIEFAIAEQSLTTGCGFFGWHLLNARDDGHGIATILHAGIKVVVVEFRVVGEEGWQHTLDAERATHCWHIVVAFAERVEEVKDMVGYVQEVDSEVGIERCQFTQTATLKLLIISKGAGIHGNISVQFFCQLAAWVAAVARRKKFTVFYVA